MRHRVAALALGLLALLPMQAARAADSSVFLSAEGGWAATEAPGGWAPYRLLAHNQGNSVFTGELRLVPDPSLGVPAGSHVDGATIYSAPVRVPPHGQATVSTYALPSPNGYRAELRDAGGRLVAALRVGPPAQGTAIGLLTASDRLVQQLRDYGLPPVNIPAIVRFAAPTELPDSAAQLVGLRALLIAAVDLSGLDSSRVQALRDFVAFGGGLVIATGAAWTQTAGHLPAELAPLRPFGTAVSVLDQPPAIETAGGEPAVTVATGAIVDGRVVAASGDGRPLAVERDFGAGRVVELAYDPAASPLAGTPRGSLSLAQALRRATGQVGDLGVDRRDASPYDQLLPAVALGASGRMVPSQPLLLGLLLVFVLAAGPVGFIAAAKARRRWLYWFAPPLAGVLLAGSAYGLAQAGGRGGVRDQVVETVVVSPDGTGLVTAFHALTLPGSAEWRASVPPGTMVSLNPSPEDHLRTRLGVSQLDQLGGLYAPAEEYVRFGPAEAVLRDVPAQSTRVLETRSVRLVGPWLFAHLAYRGGAIAGTVRNAGSEPVEEVLLVSADGSEVLRLADRIPGRATVFVNALPAPNDSRTAVARAAGWGLSSYPGTFSLVAFGPPRSALLVNGTRPARSGLAAYAAPVRLETADSLPAGWSFARLVSQGVPDQPEELYEIGVPAGVRGDLRLLYLAPKGGLALSLWIYSSAARNWRNTLLQVGEAEVLQPGESDDGLVRILIGGVYRFTPDQLVVASGP
jgi:hypothetical protein